MKDHTVAIEAARWWKWANARSSIAFACCSLTLSVLAVSGCGRKESVPDPLEAALPAGREVFEGIVKHWNNNDTASLVEYVNGKSILENPTATVESLRKLRNEVGAIRHHADFKLVHNTGKAGQDGNFIGASTMVTERGAVVLRLGLDHTHAVVHFSMTGRQTESTNRAGSSDAPESD